MGIVQITPVDVVYVS